MFCRDVLREEIVIDMLDCGDNFVFWCEDMARRQGADVAAMLSPQRYPHISVLSAVELPTATSLEGNLHRVAILEPVSSCDSFVALLTECAEKVDQYRQGLQARQRQHESDRLLREEQDREFEQARKQDAEREMSKKQKEEAKKAEEVEQKKKHEARRLAAERREKAIETARRRRQELAERFREEDMLRLREPLAQEEITRICLRFPHGGVRVDRQFSRWETLEKLYEWAESADVIKSGNGGAVSIPLHFQLSIPLSGKQLHTEKHRTLDHLGLYPNALVLLTEVCVESEDDDL
eukprot:GHVS01028036.1.p1 GENE.GHVS01028036.1~~GHVS01028036.1.p1  ORF type:complete len:294 (+),score=51.49 GHVS01028036.1:196-1077(+)